MERELVEEARRGSREAFATLVHGCVDRLYAIAYRVLRDPDLAEDATQQALIDMWDGLPGLRDPDRFDGWSYRLVVRASYREARRDGHRVADIRDIATLDAAQGSLPDGDPLVSIAFRDELERAFRDLTPEHRVVLVLRYYLELPLADIADVLEIPPGTAASRLHYALRNLRAACDTADRTPAIRRIWA